MYSGVRTELSRRLPAQPKMREAGNGVVVAAGGIHMPLLAKDARVAVLVLQLRREDATQGKLE